MNAKENLLAAIYFASPRYVPMGCEDFYYLFQLAGNFRPEDWTDLWGVEWKVGIKGMVPFPKGNPLPTLKRLEEYSFPDPNALVFDQEIKSALSKIDRGEKLIIGQLSYLLFERAWAVMGMNEFLMSLITHPGEVHYFLHKIAEFDRKVFDRYLEIGVDGVWFSEDLGSQRALMMSPQMFREFLHPEYKYIFENLWKENKIIYFHSCGCINAVARDLAEVGVSILNPVQKRANDISKLKQDTYGKTTLEGAIDTNILYSGTPEDVRLEVIRVMEILKPGGGYICCPDQMLDFPKPNLDMLWKTARETGRY